MSHAPTHRLSRRLSAIRRDCADRSLDALVVTSRSNILYLTNFTGSSAVAVLASEHLWFITDFRYLTAIEESRGTPYECPELELVRVDSSYDETLASVLAAMSPAGVGFEAEQMTVSQHRALEAALKASGAAVTLVATEGIVEGARSVKDDYEVAVLREGARRLSRVAEAAVGEVRAGRTERAVAAAIDARMREAGFSRPAFDTIVAGGPNAALPHAEPGERIFTEGDLVVLDFGGVYDSYCVDLTRTVVVGRASARARGVYHAVLEAHDRAIAEVRPGCSRFAIDQAARGVLRRHGLGDAFGHGTGHGLGIDVHERPRITWRREGESGGNETLEAGMVFTVEPGVYLQGWGGVRIEDDVLVTSVGVEVLTDVSTQLHER